MCLNTVKIILYNITGSKKYMIKMTAGKGCKESFTFNESAVVENRIIKNTQLKVNVFRMKICKVAFVKITPNKFFIRHIYVFKNHAAAI